MGFAPTRPRPRDAWSAPTLTLQDRLVKEFRLAGISSIAAANALMPTFIEAYNRKFAKVPRNPHDAHRPLRPEEDLDLILALAGTAQGESEPVPALRAQALRVGRHPGQPALDRQVRRGVSVSDGSIEIRVAGQHCPTPSIPTQV
jgi:hypothetical protein